MGPASRVPTFMSRGTWRLMRSRCFPYPSHVFAARVLNKLTYDTDFPFFLLVSDIHMLQRLP